MLVETVLRSHAALVVSAACALPVCLPHALDQKKRSLSEFANCHWMGLSVYANTVTHVIVRVLCTHAEISGPAFRVCVWFSMLLCAPQGMHMPPTCHAAVLACAIHSAVIYSFGVNLFAGGASVVFAILLFLTWLNSKTWGFYWCEVAAIAGLFVILGITNATGLQEAEHLEA